MREKGTQPKKDGKLMFTKESYDSMAKEYVTEILGAVGPAAEVIGGTAGAVTGRRKQESSSNRNLPQQVQHKRTCWCSHRQLLEEHFRDIISRWKDSRVVYGTGLKTSDVKASVVQIPLSVLDKYNILVSQETYQL